MLTKRTLAVGSQNPVKINAASSAFERAFPTCEWAVSGTSAPSGVSDQPMNYEQTRLGAFNRVTYLKASTRADFFIAYEGGVDVFNQQPCTFAIVCISNGEVDRYGQTATLPIPPNVYDQLVAGEELGPSMDKMFNTHNIKQKGGAIGQLTNGLETRTSAYVSASIMALAPFVHADLFTSL